MDEAIKELPIIDKALGEKLAGGQRDLADEILTALAKSLPSELALIHRHYTENNIIALRQCTHKLHGAVAYCGLPRLKAYLAYFQSQVRNPEEANIAELINELSNEIHMVINATSKQ